MLSRTADITMRRRADEAMSSLEHVLATWAMVQINGGEKEVGFDLVDDWMEVPGVEGAQCRALDFGTEYGGILWSLPRGLAFPSHYHESSEWLIVLRGNMRLWVDHHAGVEKQWWHFGPWKKYYGQMHELVPGKMVYIPAMVRHAGRGSILCSRTIVLTIYDPPMYLDDAVKAATSDTGMRGKP